MIMRTCAKQRMEINETGTGWSVIRIGKNAECKVFVIFAECIPAKMRCRMLFFAAFTKCCQFLMFFDENPDLTVCPAILEDLSADRQHCGVLK